MGNSELFSISSILFDVFLEPSDSFKSIFLDERKRLLLSFAPNIIKEPLGITAEVLLGPV